MTRFGYVMVTYFSIMGVAIASFIPTPTRLVWNVSASAPIGLYAVDPPGDLNVTIWSRSIRPNHSPTSWWSAVTSVAASRC